MSERTAGWCIPHNDLAWKYDDGSIQCMYSLVVETDDRRCDFMPGRIPPTTEEWLKEPLTVRDVEQLEDFLHSEGGVQSMWPWPLIVKVLAVARQAVGGDDDA